MRYEGVREALGAAAGKHPPGKMRGGAEHQPEGGGDGVLERQHAVGGKTREKRARRGVSERARGEPARRPDCVASKPCEHQRMPGPSRRTEHRLLQAGPVCDGGPYQLRIRGSIRPQPGGRVAHIVHHDRGPSIVQRMCTHPGRPYPLEAVLRQRQRSERRRDRREGMHGRADVMHEPGQGQLRRAHASAGNRVRLEHRDGPAGLGQEDRGGKAVRSGSDDNGVKRMGHRLASESQGARSRTSHAG